MEQVSMVVYIGRDADETRRIRQALEAARLGFRTASASVQGELVEMLREPTCVCVVSATDVADLPADRLLPMVKAVNPLMPVVFVVEVADEELACDLMARGASGYVLKTPRYAKRLPSAISKVCEHQRAVRELQRLSAAFDHSVALKNEFLANMSHEIRTPMNAILGFADILGEDETDPARRQHLNIIRESGRQLLKIIDDVLDFAKLETGQITARQALFPFREMLHAVHRQHAPQADQQQVDFTLELAGDMPQCVYGDEARIRQLLGNVVHNAIKFTRKGFVVLQCAYEGQSARFRIADSGIGIPAEKVNGLLAPFAQVDASATRHHGGAGLGLAITQKLVRLMNGTLTVNSIFGQGTTVAIELPLPADAPDNGVGRN